VKVSELMDGIRNKDIVLPEFQREYVWTREQAKQLVASLVKGYPVGGLLFWKTDKPPELKNLTISPERVGTTMVMLDGQQRLTTLYLLTQGEIPCYYTESDLKNDPRSLYYDLRSGDLQYYQPSRMKDDPAWVRVVDCLRDGINVFNVAKDLAQEGQDPFKLAEELHARVSALVDMKKVDIPLQTVPFHASLDEAIDIFDLVNSQGTKLTDAELALTHVTGKWSEARRVLKAKIKELAVHNLQFDLTFMTRALTGVVTKRALFEQIHAVNKPELLAGWSVVDKTLSYLSNILPQHACIHSTQDLNTTNILIPLIVYIAINEGRFPNDRSMKNAIHWLYAAHMWARYTAQTDQRLEHDVSLVVREESPWDALREQIIDQRGRTEVKASDLEGRGRQHPFYRAVFILAKTQGAVDWMNGTALGKPQAGPYKLHSHHIFPRSLLRKEGYDPQNHLHRKVMNEIANRAFLTAEANQAISNRPPDEYLPEIEENFPGALAHQFIPMDPSLWRLDRYEDFLATRREIIALKMNEYMDSLIVEREPVKERPLSELILLGESLSLEFKSTLQWDIVERRPNKALRHSVLKTIAAFLNTEGGVLVIGVEDDGNVCGLERDLAVLDGSTDKFSQLLAQLITDRVGPEYGHLAKVRYEQLDGETVCVVDVDKAPEPAYLVSEKGKQFYIRVGNTSRALDPEQMVNHISMNW
jgi:hypothetical protein